MLTYLISLLFKKAFRSSIWQKNLAINLIIGFFMFILVAEFFLLGIFLDKLLLEIDPDGAPEMIIEQGLIYYFLITFLMRFYTQNLPTIEIGNLLHLPITRSKIVNFIQIKSLTSLFNFIPFIIFFPFSMIYMTTEYSFSVGIIWFLAILFFELSSNYLLIFLKRKSNNSIWVFVGFLVFFGSIYLIEKFSDISLSNVSLNYFEKLQTNFYLIFIPIILFLLTYYNSYRYLIRNSYLENLPDKTEKSETLSSKFNKLNDYGRTGSLILNEIRLLFRNKRSKTILFMIPIFLLYGLIFYPQETYLNSYGWLVFVGIFVTGGFLMSYGQYILAWESRHFDFIQSSNISRLDFFTAKYYLIALPTIAMYFITTPYVYFGREVLLINTMAAIYNIGINGPLLLFTASFNKKRMELDKGGSMNYQGLGINNFIVVIPLMGLPVLGFQIISYLSSTNIALAAFTITGILGILFHKYLISKAVQFFESRRYSISEGFRQQ
jgi:hypothetical protein